MLSDGLTLSEGYYWARHDDGTTFIVLLEDGNWFVPGVARPINARFRESQVICPIPRLSN